MCVAHHGYQQVKQQDVWDHREGTVHHVNDWGCNDGMFHRQVYEAYTELKLGEESDGEGAIRRDGVRVLGHVHHPQG